MKGKYVPIFLGIVAVAVLALFIIKSPYRKTEEKKSADDVFQTVSTAPLVNDKSSDTDTEDFLSENIVSDKELDEFESTPDYDYSLFPSKTEDEQAEYDLLHPIEVYYSGNTLCGTTFFGDADIVLFAMMSTDDYKHSIPFFYEDLGITEDVYLVYERMETYDMGLYNAKESYFYYTTDYDLYEAFSSDTRPLIEDEWGYMSLYYEMRDYTISFRNIRNIKGNDAPCGEYILR